MLSTSKPSILSMDTYRSCRLCPRQCGADRTVSAGRCGCGSRVKAARAALHMWEEPCISGTGGSNTSNCDTVGSDSSGCGTGGSGTVFFSGCTLGCRFCQNYPISHGRFGKEISVRHLADCFLNLQKQGAYNINLVTATQYLPSVTSALDLVRDRLTIPVVYNCGGYERPEVVRALDGYVRVWLPDLKYYSRELSLRYSQAEDYFSYASRAVRQMIEQTGPPVLDSQGIMQSGVIVRHMVLPGARQDSIRLLRWMKENLPEGGYYLSLMSQYTPAGAIADCPELNRRVTTYEYESVLNTALDLGLNLGYMQKKSSAKEEFTPPFNLEGL